MATKVLHGDCQEWIPKAAKKVDGFDFAFLDPPFNIGQGYSGYDDDQTMSEYAKMVLKAVSLSWVSLRPAGILALHGPDALVDLYLCWASAAEVYRLAWVNWHYRFGQHRDTSWIDARCHCLIYAKDPNNHTWNPDDILVDSDRASKYADKRTTSTVRPGKRVPGTIWGVPSDGPYWGRVTGNNAERQPECPNQLPEKYLERLIRAYTNPGDTVLDPFAGSGTTAVVADALGRNVVTIDISATNVAIVKARLEAGAVRI